jgi:Zn-dependent protease
VHEFFHAWTAYRFGDDTAARMGRLTLNPLAHLDLVGTIVMVVSGFRFGWAKPVPVNLLNLRNPRVADFWISAAGPLSNFALAFLSGMALRLFEAPPVAQQILLAGVVINVTLGLFNLLPLFPLDGSHVLRNLLPRDMGNLFAEFDRFAPWVLLALVAFPGVLWRILGPPANSIITVLIGS